MLPSPTVTARHVHGADLVGTADVMERLGTTKSIVNSWIKRRAKTGYPEPRWIVSGNPAWCWECVRAWHKDFVRDVPTPRLDHDTRHGHAADPVGMAEVMARLGESKNLVHSWIKRRATSGYPEPRWSVSGSPAWCWACVEAWHKEFVKGPRNRWRRAPREAAS